MDFQLSRRSILATAIVLICILKHTHQSNQVQQRNPEISPEKYSKLLEIVANNEYVLGSTSSKNGSPKPVAVLPAAPSRTGRALSNNGLDDPLTVRSPTGARINLGDHNRQHSRDKKHGRAANNQQQNPAERVPRPVVKYQANVLSGDKLRRLHNLVQASMDKNNASAEAEVMPATRSAPSEKVIGSRRHPRSKISEVIGTEKHDEVDKFTFDKNFTTPKPTMGKLVTTEKSTANNVQSPSTGKQFIGISSRRITTAKVTPDLKNGWFNLDDILLGMLETEANYKAVDVTEQLPAASNATEASTSYFIIIPKSESSSKTLTTVQSFEAESSNTTTSSSLSPGWSIAEMKDKVISTGAIGTSTTTADVLKNSAKSLTTSKVRPKSSIETSTSASQTSMTMGIVQTASRLDAVTSPKWTSVSTTFAGTIAQTSTPSLSTTTTTTSTSSTVDSSEFKPETTIITEEDVLFTEDAIGNDSMKNLAADVLVNSYSVGKSGSTTDHRQLRHGSQSETTAHSTSDHDDDDGFLKISSQYLTMSQISVAVVCLILIVVGNFLIYALYKRHRQLKGKLNKAAAEEHNVEHFRTTTICDTNL